VRKTFDRLVCFWISGPAGADARLQHVTVTVKDGWMFCIAGPGDIAHAALFAPGSSLRGKPDAASIVSRLLDEPEAAAMMRDAVAWRCSAVHARNAASSALDRIGGERWLACGDALQTVDPLSSQGVFTALEQGGMAARAIAGMRDGNGENRALYAAQIRRSFQDYSQRRASYYGHPASP
jgi:flavin-dependent dehydrogenase